MPAHSLFACPDCLLQRVVETDRTYPSPPIHATPSNPEPALPHQERDRYCVWCGCEFETTEKVVQITKRGDPDKVRQARAFSLDENADVPTLIKLLVKGDRESVQAAYMMLRLAITERPDDGQRRLFDLKELA